VGGGGDWWGEVATISVRGEKVQLRLLRAQEVD